MAINVTDMTWKSTSPNGWEYLIVWEDLSLSPMYAIVCYLILLFSDDVFGRDK